MSRRSTKSQSTHDAEVKRIAKELAKKGYEVKADISGYSKPDTIGGYRPDVVAQKGKERKIVEVETLDSVKTARDISQQRAFRNAANRSNKTTFRRTVVDTDNKN